MVDLSAKGAAAQIVSLINSRPATPWPHEIEAIIARVVAPAAPRTPVLGGISPALTAAFAEWEAERERYEAFDEGAGRTNDEDVQQEMKRLSGVFSEKSTAVLAFDVQSLADLQLLLPVVVYWNSPFSAKSPPYPDCTLEEGGEDEGESLEPKSPAYFIRAVVRLLGKLTCADGGPNLSTDYAEFVAAANSMHAFARTGPKVCGPECDTWEEQFSKLGDTTSECAERILKSANPDPRALAAIIWHYLADASLERGIDLSNLPEPVNFGIGQDAAVLLAAHLMRPGVPVQWSATSIPTSCGDMRRRLVEVDRMFEAAGDDFDKIGAADSECRDLSDEARRIWAKSPTTIEDLRLRAEIAGHWHRQEAGWKVPTDCDEWPDECVAHLIQAVLNFSSQKAGE